MRRSDEPLPRITDSRHAGFGYHRNGFSVGKLRDELIGARRFARKS